MDSLVYWIWVSLLLVKTLEILLQLTWVKPKGVKDGKKIWEGRHMHKLFSIETVLKSGGIWRDICRIDEKRVASIVQEEKVDILLELTGHTSNNKLGMMACCPAPTMLYGCEGVKG